MLLCFRLILVGQVVMRMKKPKQVPYLWRTQLSKREREVDLFLVCVIFLSKTIQLVQAALNLPTSATVVRRHGSHSTRLSATTVVTDVSTFFYYRIPYFTHFTLPCYVCVPHSLQQWATAPMEG